MPDDSAASSPYAAGQAALVQERQRPAPAGRGLETLGKLFRFGVIGGVSIVVYLGLYALLRTVAEPTPANLIALVGTALVNTEAHRRWTFRADPAPWAKHYRRAGLIFLGDFVATTAVLKVAEAVIAPDQRWVEVLVLGVAAAVLAAVRFVLLDRWAFRHRSRA